MFALKSGTNDFHGSLVGILQNEDMNANSYAAVQAGKPRAEDRFNLFSGSIGGPVRIPKLYNGKDKSFFFFNFERDQIANLGFGGPNVTMPTGPMMQGDFSAWLNPALTQNSQSGTVVTKDILGRPVVFGQIYNPATTRILTAGKVDPGTGLTATSSGLVRDPFPNNQIPTSLFDPVAANILKLQFPRNYFSSQVVSNVPTLASTQPTLLQHFITVKGDQVLTSKQKLSLLYDYDFRNLINTCGLQRKCESGAGADPAVRRGRRHPLRGWSRYDALQATLNKQTTKDLSFLINYTWSKTLTDTNGGVQDVANLKAEKTVASFLHVPQMLKVTAIYALPFGKGKMVNLHGPLDWVLGEWKLTGNGIYESGDTLSITDSFVSNGIFATTRPNYTGQPVELN